MILIIIWVIIRKRTDCHVSTYEVRFPWHLIEVGSYPRRSGKNMTLWDPPYAAKR